MPTLQEIIAATPVSQGDGWAITKAMNVINGKDTHSVYSDNYNDYVGEQIVMDNVVDVMYDHRRGARTSVLRFNTVPFAIVSCAGRELDDVENVYILDREYAGKALRDWCINPEFDAKDVYNPEAEIGLAYWEGTEVELGDTGMKYTGY